MMQQRLMALTTAIRIPTVSGLHDIYNKCLPAKRTAMVCTLLSQVPRT